MSENPYESPRASPGKPLAPRSYAVLTGLSFFVVPAAAILAGTTCGATFLSGVNKPIAMGLIGAGLGFIVLVITLLIGSRLVYKPVDDQKASYTTAFMRLLIAIPISLIAFSAVVLAPLFLLPQAYEVVLWLGPFIGGIGAFFVLALAYWSGLRKQASPAP